MNKERKKILLEGIVSLLAITSAVSFGAHAHNIIQENKRSCVFETDSVSFDYRDNEYSASTEEFVPRNFKLGDDGKGYCECNVILGTKHQVPLAIAGASTLLFGISCANLAKDVSDEVALSRRKKIR